MPGAFNLPYNDLLDPRTGTVLPADQLKARIAASGIDPKSLPEEELIAAMVENPILVERPIVVSGGKAALGRPPEAVLSVL